MQNQLQPKNPKNNNDNNHVIPIDINGGLPTCEDTQPYIKQIKYTTTKMEIKYQKHNISSYKPTVINPCGQIYKKVYEN